MKRFVAIIQLLFAQNEKKYSWANSPEIWRKIGYDFSEDIGESGGLMLEEPETEYSDQPLTIQEAVKQRNE